MEPTVILFLMLGTEKDKKHISSHFIPNIQE